MAIHTEDFEARREVIRSILASCSVRNQAALLRQLARRGYKVTQSSVSRDLQELKVIKVDGRYVLAESFIKKSAAASSGNGELLDALSWIRKIEPAGDNILVLQTPPGRATALALALDHAGWPEAVGTIAGDDTIFIAVRSRREQVRLSERLSQMSAR
jgi:transcriptional regulator of arginine metabolism